MVKRIGSALLLLCLAFVLAGQALAAPGVSESGGSSTIEIEQVTSLQVSLTITVKDESGAALSGVTVKLIDPANPQIPPITGSDGSYVTDADGKIVISLFPDKVKQYRIEIVYTGYERYTGDPFTVTADTSQAITLKKSDNGGGSAYWVYYHAGAGGVLQGAEKEYVLWNARPKKVPTPKADEGWNFDGWYADAAHTKPVEDPATLRIRGTTHLYATFTKLPVVVVPTPTPDPTPTDTPPMPTDSGGALPPHPGGGGSNGNSGGNSGGTTGKPGGGTGTGDGTDTTPPTHTDIPVIGPGGVTPVEPGGPTDPVSPVGPDVQPADCPFHWEILALTVLTLVGALLRLRYLSRRLAELEHAEEREEVTV